MTERNPDRASSTEIIPDYPEPLRAFRVWRVDVRIPQEAVFAESSARLLVSTLPTVLRSRNGLAAWRPGRNVAECRWFEYGPPSWPEKGPPTEAHEAPCPECGCGLYGALDPPPPKVWWHWDDAGCHLLIHFYVSGLMEAWGRVIEHETGLRAQYARVIALLDPSGALGLCRSDQRSVDSLMRRAAETYDAIYVTDPAHLRAIHAHGVDWFPDRTAELEPEPTRAPAKGKVALLPPIGVGPMSFEPEEVNP